MKVLVDMNLSPRWVQFLATKGIEAVHWSAVGDPRADDSALMKWAAEHGFLVFTHDLDFSALLAATGAKGPSVIQMRAQDVLPDARQNEVVKVLAEHAGALEDGAIVTIDHIGARVRVLPLRRG